MVSLRTLLAIATLIASSTTTSGVDAYSMPGAEVYASCQTETGAAVAATPATNAPRILGSFTSAQDDVATANDPVRSYDNFYTKYTNAYDETNTSVWPASKGIPILGTDTTADVMMLTARATVVNMLRARPWRSSPYDVRDYMVSTYQRVIATGDEVRDQTVKFGLHPEAEHGTELGGATAAEPSTGYESYGACYPQTTDALVQSRDVLVEEFGHSIEDVAIRNIDPCTFSRIGKAMCLAVAANRFSCKSWLDDGSGLEVCASEWYASMFELAFGDNDINYGGFSDGDTGTPITTRAALLATDPTAYCLVAAYYDMSATPVQDPTAQAKCDGTNGYPQATTSNGIGALPADATMPDCAALFAALDANTSCNAGATESGRVVPSTVCSGVTVPTSIDTQTTPTPTPTSTQPPVETTTWSGGLSASTWTPYALIRTKFTTSKDYTDGYTTIFSDEFVNKCSDFVVVPAGNLVVRVTMGTYVDYFKLTGSLCQIFTETGVWYWHSYVGRTGPWKAVPGNHGALLLGFTPYASDDTRTWGPFVGAPNTGGYYAEGGGCCHNAAGAPIQFWRMFTIDLSLTN